MERYQIFAVDGPDSGSDNAETTAVDHVEAVARAGRMFPDHGAIEVWCGTRLIARLDRDVQSP